MKTLQINKILKMVDKSAALFNPTYMDRIRGLLAGVTTDNDLEAINGRLIAQNRRKIDLSDIVRIAYVHAQSIYENNGYSPYTRLIAFNAKNGFDYDKVHCKVVTEILLQSEFMRQTGSEDRKKKQCRQYELYQDVHAEIYRK